MSLLNKKIKSDDTIEYEIIIIKYMYSEPYTYIISDYYILL